MDWPTAEEAARARLFSPVVLGASCVARTRTWVPAMVPWRATPDGFVTQDLLDWYGRLADGRPGVIVVEATGVRDVPSGPLLRISDDRFVAGLAGIVDVIRRRSGGETKVFVQLIDFLRIRRRPEPARYLREFLALCDEHRARLRALDPSAVGATDAELRERLVAASEDVLARVLSPREQEDLRMGFRQRVTDLHDPEVAALPSTLPLVFAAAARRAALAGFDGVELHAAHAYTLASYLSARNARSDGYGQTLDGRVRLPLEVLARVRDAVAPATVVGVRFLGEEAIAGGYGPDDAAFFGVSFARAGADYLSLSKGGKFEDARQPTVGSAAYPYTGPSGLECIPNERLVGGPRGRHLPLARAVRAAVRAAGFQTPVVAAGGLHTFRDAEDALARGDLDVVAAARQSLADPDWWLKMREGRGASIRACTRTSYCEGLDQKHKKVTCRLWDRQPVLPEETVGTEGGRRLIAPP